MDAKNAERAQQAQLRTSWSAKGGQGGGHSGSRDVRHSLKRGYCRLPVEAAGSEQDSRQQEETATRGKFISQRIAVFACRRTSVRRNRHPKRQPLLPTFGFARAAGPNHWPKERSARKSAVRPERKNKECGAVSDRQGVTPPCGGRGIRPCRGRWARSRRS